MVNLTSLVVSILLIAFVATCDKCDKNVESNFAEDEQQKDKCISLEFAPVLDVQTYFGETEEDNHYFEVKYLVKNGCGGFGNFRISKNNEILDISVIAKYDGCMCTMVMQELTQFYELNTGELGDIKVVSFQGENNKSVDINIYTER